MNTHPLYRALRIASLTAGAVLAFAGAAQAGLQVPYTPDASTLHLWHIDDPLGSLTLTDAVASSSILLTNLGAPASTLGQTAAPGLGSAALNNFKPHALYGGLFPDVSQFCNPVSGAFSFECLVQFNINPRTPTNTMELVAGDNSTSGGTAARGWQWRINVSGAMEWNLIAGNGSDNDFSAALPASGSDVANAGAWYHAAVTFTGYNPTNGDSPGVLTMYWTPLDASRTKADKLASFTMTRSLGGATYSGGVLTAAETATPGLAISGSGRNYTYGNNEGVIGLIDEVRISDVARTADQMAIGPGGSFPPVIVTQPPTNTLVGYGRPLLMPVVVSGTAPLYYQWLHQGTNPPGQNDSTLNIPSPDFSAAGNYQLVVTNIYGSATSQVANVVVGAAPAELFSTGLDTNGLVSAGDIPDPHWSLYRSSDPSFLGPNAMIFETSYPLQFVDPNGNYTTTNGHSMWISPQGNQGGNLGISPSGSYTYRTRFLLDSADPSTVTLQASFSVNSAITDILINGHSTGFTYSLPPLYWDIGVQFTNSSFLVQGINTLDVVVSNPNSAAALRVDQLQGVGLALPPGLPTLLAQPANQTVRDASVAPGSQASFAVVASGRPPLSYQWWADGAPLSGATQRTLNLVNPTAGAQGIHYSVVVANTSGSVTSQVATLTLVSSNQPPVADNYTLVLFPGQNLNLALSQLIEDSIDPDHDAISYFYADGSSTNGSSISQVGASLVYSPTPGYVGADQFTYTIGDSQSATGQGSVTILNLAAPAPFNPVLVGGTTNLSAGVATLPVGCTAQWQFNGTNLPGATAAQLTIANAQAANVGAYRLSVTGSSGQTTTSPAAMVGLNGAPGPKFNSVPSGWAFNGYGTATALSNNVLRLTDGVGSEGRSAWFTWPQDISAFSASFIYQDVGGGGADGFALVLQDAPSGTTALGPGGGALAYQGIGNSVALEFNIYAPHTVGIALESNGTVSSSYTPTDPAVNLASGHPIQVNLSYAAGTAQLALTDLNTMLSTNIAFDVVGQLGATFENLIGTNIAYVGFTGSDGGTASTQTISNFVFRPPSISVAVQAAASNVLLSWTPSYSGFVLQSATNVSGPWQNVTTPVTTAGSQYQVATPWAAGAQFYRLSLP